MTPQNHPDTAIVTATDVAAMLTDAAAVATYHRPCRSRHLFASAINFIWLAACMALG